MILIFRLLKYTFYFLFVEFQRIFFHLRCSNNILCLLSLYFPPRGQWMDYRLGSLGNSSTASGDRDPGRTYVRPAQ